MVRQEAERLAKQYNLPVAELLAHAQKISVARARFRSQTGREMTVKDLARVLAAEHGLSAADVLAELEQILRKQRSERS
jgi:hypothetical protein